jgi:uncharacterized cupin superfamily protein
MSTVPGLRDVDALGARLEPIGPKPNATEGDPVEAALVLHDDGRVQVGIWECTPGTFPSARDGISEVMAFVAGDATITDADGTRHEVRPGVVMHVPDGWRGTWEIRTTVRKTYTVVHAD